jgi:branched-chain amino acid transport system permease protein
MVVIGGLGSVHGAFLGAIFLITMPQLINASKDFLPEAVGQAPGLKAAVYGAGADRLRAVRAHGPVRPLAEGAHLLQIFPFYRKGMFKRQKSFQKSDRLR